MHPDIEKLFTVAGQAAVVTGAGAGIGRGIATCLALAGADVAVADLDPRSADSVAGEIRQRGRRAVAIQADVGDESSVKAMIDRAVQELGRLDILVNNAGIYPLGSIAELSADDWDRVMRVNLRGTFLCTREAARAMRAAGRGGRIVNISSTESFHPTPLGLSHYGASKAGVNQFTRNAALELAADGINVNAVCPGGTVTEGTADIFKDGLPPELESRIPLRRFATPEDIAAVVLFLASKASGYITGATILADGGYLLT